MGSIKLAYHIFCKNLLSSIIVTVQIVALLFITNEIIVTTNDFYKTVNIYNECGLSDIKGVIVDCGSENSISPKVLESIDGIKYCETGNTIMYDYYNFITYSRNFVEDYKPKISEGKWLNEYNGEMDTIPVVLTYPVSDFRVGDIITIDEELDIKINIVGVLNDPYYFSLSAGGTGMNTRYVMKNAYSAYSYMPLLTLSDYVELFPGYEYNSLSGTGKAIILKNSADEEKALEITNKNYVSRTFKDILEFGKDEAFARIRALSPFVLLLFLISIIGLAGCISLSTLKNLNFYSVLYLQGASAQKSTFISMIYVTFYILIAFILFLSIFFAAGKTMCIYNWIASVLILCLLITLSFIPYKILKSNPPIECFRESE